MSHHQYLVGQRVKVTVTVTDKATGSMVDPGSLLFTLRGGGGTHTYAWDGSAWTVSESMIADPSRVSLGVFALTITIPYTNGVRGAWHVGWKTTENGSGLGEGADQLSFVVVPSSALGD